MTRRYWEGGLRCPDCGNLWVGGFVPHFECLDCGADSEHVSIQFEAVSAPWWNVFRRLIPRRKIVGWRYGDKRDKKDNNP